MELIVAFVLLVIGLIGFDAVAMAHGADSRDQMPDDHRR